MCIRDRYNLYLSVGSGFHNAQKGQTTLPRVAGRGEAACLERKGYARRALSTRKTRYFSHNSFGTKRHTAKAWFLQALFPQPESSPGGERGEGQGAAVSGLGSIYHACAAGATPEKRNSVFFVWKKTGRQWKKAGCIKKTQTGISRMPAAWVRIIKKAGFAPRLQKDRKNRTYFTSTTAPASVSCFLASSASSLLTPSSVSYTHLDVYKRQDWSGRDRARCRNRSTGPFPDRPWSVSYTHLRSWCPDR